MVWVAIGDAKKEALHSWGYRRGRSPRAWKAALLALLWVIWSGRSRRAFEGVEQDFAKRQNSLVFLVCFWCSHETPTSIEDWVSFFENDVLM